MVTEKGATHLPHHVTGRLIRPSGRKMLKQVYKDKWKLDKQGAVDSGMSGESITGGGDQVRDPGMGGTPERR